jgi:hypothetical protein
MPNTIRHKRSSTAGLVPGTGSLDQGELAINIADGKFYTKNSSNSVINLGITSISGTAITPATGVFSGTLDIGNIKISGNSISATNTNGNLILSPIGSGALQLSSIGNTRGSGSVDLQRTRSSNSQVASAINSVICGGGSNTASGLYSSVLGGLTNTALANYSSVAGGNNNSASATYSSVVGGYSNTANGTHSFIGAGISNNAYGSYSVACGGSGNTSISSFSAVCGGYNNNAEAEYSAVCGGSDNEATGSTHAFIGGGASNTASGPAATVLGGLTNTASAWCSTVTGGENTVAYQRCEEARSAGKFNENGDAQIRTLILRGTTTTTNAVTNLTFDGTLNLDPDDNSVISHNRYNPADSTKQYSWYFTVKVIGRSLSSTDPQSGAYRFEGVLESSSLNGAVLLGNTKTVIHEDNADWECDIFAFNGSSIFDKNGFYIECSNLYSIAEDIYWVAHVEIVEVGVTEPAPGY